MEEDTEVPQSNGSLKDDVFSSKWQVRRNAFKKINQLFVKFDPNVEMTKEDEMYGSLENPFDNYGSVIEQMIKDNNLTAQFEGLNCLLTFVKLSKDIKSVTFSCNSYLLDKVQHNKQNLREITSSII